MKVKCISTRESMPKQITIDSEYYVKSSSIWGDRDGDWYAEVYEDKKFKISVGMLKFSHFTRIE